jgi:hypothetical protein
MFHFENQPQGIISSFPVSPVPLYICRLGFSIPDYQQSLQNHSSVLFPFLEINEAIPPLRKMNQYSTSCPYHHADDDWIQLLHFGHVLLSSYSSVPQKTFCYVDRLCRFFRDSSPKSSLACAISDWLFLPRVIPRNLRSTESLYRATYMSISTVRDTGVQLTPDAPLHGIGGESTGCHTSWWLTCLLGRVRNDSSKYLYLLVCIIIKENDRIILVAINYIVNQTSRNDLDFHKACSLTTADKAPRQF